MRRITVPVLLLMTMLSACLPMQVNTPPPLLDTVTPIPNPTTPPDPTTIPTELAASPVIAPQNAATLENAAQTVVDPTGMLVWSADGAALAVQAFQGVTVYRLDPVTAVNTVQAPEPASILGVSPAGLLAAITEGQNDVTVKSAGTGEQVGAIHSDVTFIGGSISPDGTQVALASTENWQADLYNFVSGEKTGQLTGFETAAPVYNVRFAPSGKSIVWISRGTLQLQNIADQTMGPRLEHEDFIAAFDVSMDDKRAATSAGASIDGTFTTAVYLWDTVSGERLGLVPVEDTANSLSFSPDGSLIAADNGTSVKLWDTSNMTEAVTLSGHGGLVVAVAFSPDGRALASLSEDGTLIIWHIPNCNVCELPTQAP